MHLVLLPLEPPEEPLDAVVLGDAARRTGRKRPVDDEEALLVGEILPRDVEAQPRGPRHALQVRKAVAIVRLAPGLDRAFVDRLPLVRDDQVHIQLDGVAEAVARRTGAERVVERKEPRLRRFVRQPAAPALEALAESVRRHRRAGVVDLDRERRAVPFTKRGLDGVGQPRTHPALDANPIDDDGHRRQAAERRRVLLRFLDRDRAALHEQSSKAAPPERVQRGEQRVLPRRRAQSIRVVKRRARRFLEGQIVVPRRPCLLVRRAFEPPRHGREIEADQESRAFGEPLQLGRDQLGRLALHLPAALPADRPADASPEESQIVVDFSRGPDGRSRIADAVLLPDGNGRRDPVDRVHVRLLHPLEELPCVGRQRLDVSPLPLGVDGVEGQGRLARPAHPGEDDELPVRNRDVHALEVVSACAPDDEGASGALVRCRPRKFGHA